MAGVNGTVLPVGNGFSQHENGLFVPVSKGPDGPCRGCPLAKSIQAARRLLCGLQEGSVGPSVSVNTASLAVRIANAELSALTLQAAIEAHGREDSCSDSGPGTYCPFAEHAAAILSFAGGPFKGAELQPVHDRQPPHGNYL